MKKVLVITLIIMLFLYATNPTKSEFVDYTEKKVTQIVKDAGVTSNSFVDQLIGAVTGKAVSKAADLVYMRSNMLFFSVYRISNKDMVLSYLGIGKMFFPLENIIDSKKLNLHFPDIITLFDEKKTISEDQYSTYSVPIDSIKKVSIDIENVSGPEFEAIFTDKENYEIFKKDYFKSLKVYAHEKIPSGENIHLEYNLSRGTYYLIVDNTDFGSVIPPLNFADDEIQFKVKISKE